MKPDEVQATVEAMRDDAYRVMTGKSAPPLEGYDPVPGLVARGVMSDEHDPDSCEADCCARKIVLGQRVTFDYSDILTRQTIVPHSGPGGLYLKEWRKVTWGKRGDVRHGIIVGVRTLVNGESRWHYDEPITFHPVTYFTAYVVAYDLRRKPVHLLPDDVEVRR